MRFGLHLLACIGFTVATTNALPDLEAKANADQSLQKMDSVELLETQLGDITTPASRLRDCAHHACWDYKMCKFKSLFNKSNCIEAHERCKRTRYEKYKILGGLDEGQHVMICWMEATEGWNYTVTQADADAMKCLLNLHAHQDSRCISVAGSPCADGYGKYNPVRLAGFDGAHHGGGMSEQALRVTTVAADIFVGKQYAMDRFYIWTLDKRDHDDPSMKLHFYGRDGHMFC